jgi:dTDP-4-dehydrorhamnose 3,5-epimerase
VKAERLGIPDVILLTPPRFGDARGWFSVTWSRAAFQALGIDAGFVQDNHSASALKGTIRGLHCQIAPHTQGKLVRVIRGAVFDVAVDIRAGSATFGQHVATELSAENGCQLWIPAGFLHGFCTLENDTEVLYKVDGEYDRGSERGVIWNDPTIGIAWPLDGAEAVLSEKDGVLPPLAEAERWFSS